LGRFIPDVAAARKLRQDVFIAEIYLDRLCQHDLSQGALPKALAALPCVERDFSFVFDDGENGVDFEKIHRSVSGLGIVELRSFSRLKFSAAKKLARANTRF